MILVKVDLSEQRFHKLSPLTYASRERLRGEFYGLTFVAPTGLEPSSSYNARRVNAYWNGMQVCDGLHSIQAGSEWLMRDISEEEMSRNLLQTVLSICISVSVGAKSD